jgi:hypothetical protein
MKKRFFWAVMISPTRATIFRFRTEKERTQWLRLVDKNDHPNTTKEELDSRHPEVRRLNRRLAAGEVITFPVEIE